MPKGKTLIVVKTKPTLNPTLKPETPQAKPQVPLLQEDTPVPRRPDGRGRRGGHHRGQGLGYGLEQDGYARCFPKSLFTGVSDQASFGSLDTGMQPDSSETLRISMSYKHGSVALGLREYRTLRTPKLPNRITQPSTYYIACLSRWLLVENL